MITVAVATVRSKGGAAQGSSAAPPPGAKSPAKPAVAAAGAAPAAVLPSPAAAPTAPALSAGSQQQPAQHKFEMRVTSYYGDWRCFCGETNRLWDTCTCGQIPPCR